MAVEKLLDVLDRTAHTFLAPDAAAVVARLVEQEGFLSAFIGNDFSGELMSGPNRTINIKLPTALVARERGIDDKQTGITLDEIKESTTSLTLGKMAYSAISLSHGDLDFKISDFASQVLAPQADSVADFVENEVATTLFGLPVSNSNTETSPLYAPAYAPVGATTAATFNADPYAYLVRLRTVLRKRGIPQSNLHLIVGPGIYQQLLLSGKLSDASASGSTAALREGQVGRIAGFSVIESVRVKDSEIFAFHRDAVTLAVRAPSVPKGAPWGAPTSSGGYPLSITRSWDYQRQAEVQVVSTYLGVAVLPLFRVKRDYTTRLATVETVANGGIIRIDTAVGMVA